MFVCLLALIKAAAKDANLVMLLIVNKPVFK